MIPQIKVFSGQSKSIARDFNAFFEEPDGSGRNFKDIVALSSRTVLVVYTDNNLHRKKYSDPLIE